MSPDMVPVYLIWQSRYHLLNREIEKNARKK